VGLSPVVPHGHQEINPGRDLAAYQAPQRLFVERQVLFERSDQRRAASYESSKHVCHLF
jgi:hypothetical protein